MPYPILPESVADVLDDSATFEPAALAAVKAFARSKPWQGTDTERLEKFNACAAKLAEAYNLPAWQIAIGEETDLDAESRIATFTKLSVVTFLNFFAYTRRLPPFGQFRWSVNIFRRCFPRSFAACRQVGPYLVRE